jgi:uncharacterized membrane protein AbrB (regulator of aidB expression)
MITTHMKINCYLPFLLLLAVTFFLGWLLLVYCTIPLCWLLLGIAIAVIIAGVITCFTSLVPCMGSR